MTFKEIVLSQPNGYVRLRMPNWADKRDYMRVYVGGIGGSERSMGPWAHLFAPVQQLLDYPSPQQVLMIGDQDPSSEECWELYSGPLHEKDMN